jgi:hypothetical protein
MMLFRSASAEESDMTLPAAVLGGARLLELSLATPSVSLEYLLLLPFPPVPKNDNSGAVTLCGNMVRISGLCRFFLLFFFLPSPFPKEPTRKFFTLDLTRLKLLLSSESQELVVTGWSDAVGVVASSVSGGTATSVLAFDEMAVGLDGTAMGVSHSEYERMKRMR